MRTREIALAITFAAVAIALTAIRIPTFFYPNGSFRFSQIPVIVAFLIFGFRIGFSVGFFTLIGQIAVFPTSPSAIVIAYPMDFVSSLLMILGMYVSSKMIKKGSSASNFLSRKPALNLTLFAALFRGSIGSILDYTIVFHVLVPLFVQFTLSEAFIVGLIPSFIAYNLIVTIYTVPAAYAVAKRVSRSLEIKPTNSFKIQTFSNTIYPCRQVLN
jgi:hypothetical protein